MKNDFTRGYKIFMSGEEWRDIKGLYPYQASNSGRIRSVDRLVNSKNGKKRLCKGKILAIQKSRGGYPIVFLKFEKLHVYDIHRLIAITFLPNSEDKKWVNHKNGVKWDNRVMNLEWVTPSENRIHAMTTGLQDDRGEKSKNSKLTTEDVILMRKLRAGGEKVKDIALLFPNIHSAYINLVINNKRWKHIQTNCQCCPQCVASTEDTETLKEY